ncbi:MAG: YciI family protein [Gammaproteobacteria bacterium]
MPNYLLTYKGASKPDSPEEGQKLMARWQEWVKNVSDRIVMQNTPLGAAKTVDKNGITDLTEPVQTNGITAISADSLEDALAVAQSCPHTEIGQIEVREMFEMPGSKS